MIRRIFRLLLGAAALALLIATLLPFSNSDAWWIRYPLYPALQVGVAAALLALVLAPLLRHPVAAGAFACLLVVVAVQAVRLSPYVLPVQPAVPGGSCAPADRLRVLEVNVQRTNRHDHTLLDLVRSVQPDVAWFQEVNDWWEGELSALAPMLPHDVKEVQANYFGVHLYSKLPLSDAGVHHLADSDNPSVFATVTLPSGHAVRLYAIHPQPPQVGQSTAERDAQLMATALAARGDTVPHVVVGDLNSVPWAPVLDRLERVARVGDPRIGRGLFVTWNAHRTLAKWPLDHILPGPGLALANLRVLPPFGSDHQPLLAELCVTGQPGPPTELSPDALADAVATIKRGQGKAEDKRD